MISLAPMQPGDIEKTPGITLPFGAAAPAARGFSAPAAALAARTLRHAYSGAAWSMQFHHYGCTDGRDGQMLGTIPIMASDQGAWAVLSKRSQTAAAAELVIARLAALAGLPVAPTFIDAIRDASEIGILSVIPFTHVVRGRNIRLHEAPGFRIHYALMQPFLCWIGPYTDRHDDNVCMNADDPLAFAEYDFDHSTVKMLLNRTRSLSLPLEMPRKLENVHSYNKPMPPVLRDFFHEGARRIETIAPRSIARVIDMVGNAIGLKADKRALLNDFLMQRREAFRAALAEGRFEAWLTAADEPFTASGVLPQASRFRYSFAEAAPRGPSA